MIINNNIPQRMERLELPHAEAPNGDIVANQCDDTGALKTSARFVDGNGNELFLEDNGGLPVNVQDQTSKPIDAYFAKSLGTFTLALDTDESSETTLVYTFTATTGHGLAIGDEILLLDVATDQAFYAEILNVTGDLIELDRPIDHIFPAATALCRTVLTDMAVDGSTTPQIFSLRAGINPLDFVRFIVTMTDGTAMDDGRFGGLPKLTRGLVMRICDGFQKTIFNWKTNGEIAQWCFDQSYADKAPAGSFGFRARVTFGGQSKHGIVLRITTDDVIQFVVQDDLTGLETLRIAAQGHEVTG